MIYQPRSQWAIVNQNNRAKQLRADKMSARVWGFFGVAGWAVLVAFCLMSVTGGF